MDEATMAEIEARANAATPGPWRSGGFYGLARANDGDTAGWRHGAALPLGRCTFCRDAAGPCPATLMHRGEYDAAPRAYHAHWIAAEPGEGWQGISSDAAALAITGNYDYDRGGVCSTPEDSAFIVHARADVPALVAEVRRLTAALDAVTTERDRLQRACDEGLPREYIECPACRTRPHHTHRCYGCGHVWDAGRWSFGADVPKPAPESAALDAARREGAEEMRERCAVVLAGRAAWADYRTEHHTAPGDDPDETRTQMDALDGALAAIAALPLDAPGGGS